MTKQNFPVVDHYKMRVTKEEFQVLLMPLSKDHQKHTHSGLTPHLNEADTRNEEPWSVSAKDVLSDSGLCWMI